MTSPTTDAEPSAAELLIVEANREEVAVSTPEKETLKINTGSNNQNTNINDVSRGQYEVCAEGDDVSEGSFDVHTQTDDVSTATDDSVLAPDGGWGWVVTFSSFMVAFIVDGMVTSFGLLLPELLTTYDAGMSLTSFAPAVIVAMFLLSGPMTAYLVRRWGCRPVAFCGGLLASLGVAGSAYAPSIELFILLYGVVAGVGIGLIYLPSITMVNLYFNKKRGMVAGIVTSGSGFGLLTMAPLTETLIETYGWRGCYLIMAGIALNFCVCATLMRPLTPPKRSLSMDDEQGTPLHPGNEEKCSYIDEVANYNDTYSLHSRSRHDSTRTNDNDDNLALNIVSIEEIDNKGHHLLPRGNSHHGSVLNTKSHQGSVPGTKNHHGSGFWSSMKNVFLGDHTLGGSHAHIAKRSEIWRGGGAPMPRSKSHSYLETPASNKIPICNNGHINAFSAWLVCQVPPALSRHSLVSHQSTQDNAAHWRAAHGDQITKVDRRVRSESFSHGQRPHHNKGRVHSDQPLNPRLERPEDFVKTLVMKNQHNTHDSPLLALKVPSEKLNKDNTTTLPLVADTAPSTPSTPTEDSTSTVSGSGWRVAQWLREQRVFILFLMGAFLTQLVNNITPLLTPSYAYLHGVSKDQVATMLSVFGLVNTVGRLMAGVLVYWGWSPLRVHNLGSLLAGVACFFYPLCTTFPTITLCLAAHGLFLGAFPPLQSVLLVEYLGIERLASTFGTMCLVKAFASSAGAPLAGLLYTTTGVYTVPVVVIGAVSVLAAMVVQLMECFPKPRI
ncbi:uncharacterized protein [Littorina saxatilis]|uniref:Major facilitator superfamily (MFS) profile domain-containing protein n=2 Tax=Littorina saxatilis TaxID=31220 RepID=A0AAN9BF14_9CAEN